MAAAVGRPERRKRTASSLALDVASGDVSADLRHGPAQPRERRRDPGLRQAGGPVRRRHVHERTAHDPLSTATPWRRPRPSQSQLYSYQAGNTKNILADKGDLWAFVSDDPDLRRLLRLHAELDAVGLRPIHQGAEEHRDREELRRVRDHGGRRRLPRAAQRRDAGSGISAPTTRSGSTDPSGCSSTGASSTTSSTSSASRTSPTTSGRAWATSSTSWTPVAERRPPRRLGTLRTNGRVWKMVLDPGQPEEGRPR